MAADPLGIIDTPNTDPLGIMGSVPISSNDPLGIVKPESFISKVGGVARGTVETLGTLALAGATYGGSLVAGVGKMLPERGIGEDDVDLEEVLEGKVELDPRSFQERVKQAGELREQIMSIPGMGLRPGPAKVVEKAAIPFEMVEVAKEFWSKQAAEKLHPDMGPVVGNALEIVTLFGLPRLRVKLKAQIKAGKIKSAQKTVRDIRRQSLEKLRKEPKRFAHLAEMEKHLKEIPKTTKVSLEKLQKKAPENIKVDAILTKEEFGTDGIQVTIYDQKSPANKATLYVEKDPAKITSADIQKAVKAKEAQFREPVASIIEGDIHPNDLPIFKEIEAVSRQISQKYNLDLKAIEHKKRTTGTGGLAYLKDKKISVHVRNKKGKVWDDKNIIERSDEFLYEKGFDAESSLWHVVAHELAHLKDKSHSKNFRSLNEEIYADIQKIRTRQEPVGGETLSMLGTQEAYQRIAAEIPKLKKTAQQVTDAFSVEARFIRNKAPETGFHAKNIHTKQSVIEERGVDVMTRIAKAAKHKKELMGVDTVLAAESKNRLRNLKNPNQKKAAQELLKLFEFGKKEYHKRGAKIDFQKRIVNEIEKMIETAEPKDLPQLHAALAAAKDMNYVHIPLAAGWFDKKLTTPEGRASVMKLLVDQKRKTFNIKSLIDSGAIKASDVNVVDIVASYSRRLGHDLALLDVVNAAKTEGMAIKVGKGVEVPAHYVTVNGAPILSRHKVHPILADYLHDALGKGINLGKFGAVLSTSKMLQFINPLILPTYNMYQHSMYAFVNKWSLKKARANVPLFYTVKGVRSYLKRTPEYYQAIDNGLAPKPYNPPYMKYRDVVEWASKTGTEKFLRALETVHPKRIVMPHKTIIDLYNASWKLAWEGDAAVRMGTYHMLRDNGFSPRAAAQEAARVHANYANVPGKTRRVLNIPFLTPTFKITMFQAILGKMVGTTLKAPFKLATGKKLTKAEKLYVSGLMGVIIANEAKNQFMTRFMGMETDQWGRRWKKTFVDEDGNEKQLKITMTDPTNIVQKYIFRAMEAVATGNEKPVLNFISSNRWDIHVVWRTLYEAFANEDPKGDTVYNIEDTSAIRNLKRARYITRNIVALIGMFDRAEFDKEGREVLAKEMGRAIEVAIRPFAFVYTTSPESSKKYFRLLRLKKEFMRDVRRKIIKGKPVSPQRFENYQKRFNEILEGKEVKEVKPKKKDSDPLGILKLQPES